LFQEELVMRKYLYALFCAFLAAGSLSAQQTAQQTVQQTSGPYTITYPADFVGIEEFGTACNTLRLAFTEVFHFNPDTAERTYRIRVLPDKASFDAYVISRIGETRKQHVFLRYNKPELSELVVYPEPGASGFRAFSGPSLNRQLFLQYLYSYVAEPPVWIRDGFQAYFENLQVDVTAGTASHSLWSPWLESAKKTGLSSDLRIGSSDLLSVSTLMQDTARYYPQAWAFVSFLLNTEHPEYQRFFHEACMLLEGAGAYNSESQQENTDRIRNRFARFIDFEYADADFALWLSAQKTFNELVQAGVSAYNAGAIPDGKRYLHDALAQKPDDPLVLYYLGLCAYDEKNYSEAAELYATCLENGGEPATVNWALGLSVYADKKFKEARVYLQKAAAASPEKYSEKAAQLISSMPK